MSESTSLEANLKIRVKSKFNYGGRGTEIDIRDNELILVKKATTEREFNLPVGLYEISAFLGDGKRAAKVIEITPSQVAEVEFEPEFDYQPSHPEDDSKFIMVEGLEQEGGENIKLLVTEDDFTVYPIEDYWIVQHKHAMRKVSVLTCERNEKQIQVSLPISEGHHYSVTCHVKKDLESRHLPVLVNISQNRSIAFCLESMLKSGQVMKAADVASNALETLMEKFVDPTGALLAALILYKTGRISEWEKNLLKGLEKKYGWLPDCKIVLALHLAATHNAEEALRLACEASKERILLTESFSLLLDLLRYWPDAAQNQQRNEALMRLAKIAPLVSWEAMYLTTVTSRV
ncbi:hypothetical protein D3C76_97540 [compost metagenome]